jgi:hypothetical protein
MTKPVFKLSDDQRSSVTRWGKPIKPLAQKGKPGTPNRRMSKRVGPDGRMYEWHPTKGYRRLITESAP